MSNESWTFPLNEVQITDQILGRGAYGEVRVGRWRNILVACKRLHRSVITDLEGLDGQNALNDMKQEISILSQLRHPNLVLFLGVCSESIDMTGGFPSVILTELMPEGSLYDILEIKKVKLSMAEILDISLDISYGLQYLHSYSPAIIHRDISSKNILIGGNRAKIADLGQAKIFGSSALSRQTSMPGAFAYSAPEVMTGRYSTKIDVFSFGVLLIQLTLGEYPRIEKREEQLQKACEIYPQLASLMTDCVSFQPNDRPTIERGSETLEIIKGNDRYYPPARRLPPQSDLGVLARKWMNDQIESTCLAVNAQYDLNLKTLLAEQRRLVEEVTRSDMLAEKVTEMGIALQVAFASLEMKDIEIDKSRTEFSGVSEELSAVSQRLQRCQGDKVRLSELVEELEAKVLVESSKASRASTAAVESDKKVEQFKRSFMGLETSEMQASVREKETKMYLDMQVEQNRELEARLDQALRRWKLEKEASSLETEKYIKMRSTSASLVEQLDRANSEVELLSARLGQYDNLPLPDEIRLRLRDMARDIERTCSALQEQRINNESLRNQFELSENKVILLDVQIEEKDTALDQKSIEIKEICKNNSSLQSRLAAITQELNFNRKKVSTLDGEIILKTENEINLTMKLKTAEENEAQADRRLQIMGAAFHTGKSGGNNQTTSSKYLKSEMKLLDTSSIPVPTGLLSAGVSSDQTHGEMKHQGEDPQIEDDKENKYEGHSDHAIKRHIQTVIDGEGVRGLVRLLKENIDSEKISWRVPRALRELVVRDETVRKECSDLQCDELLLVCMQTFPLSAIVQAQALRLLGTMAYGNDQIRRRTGEKGVMRMILSTMATHGSQEESVLLHSLTAITNLMHNSVENRSRFLLASGVESLVLCMEAHKYSALIQRQSCWTILTLAASDEASRAVCDHGGGSAIVGSMLRHKDDTGVQQFGCWALGNLALAGDDIRRRLKKIGVGEVCRMAIERHGDDMEVLRQARQLMAVLGAVVIK